MAGGVLILLAVGLWMQLNATPEAATSLTIGDRTAPMTFALFAIVLLHLPDGRLPSPRWRVVLAVDALALGIAAVLAAALWPHRGPALLDLDAPWSGATATIGGIALALVVVAFVTALSSLLLRWRTAEAGVRR